MSFLLDRFNSRIGLIVLFLSKVKVLFQLAPLKCQLTLTCSKMIESIKLLRLFIIKKILNSKELKKNQLLFSVYQSICMRIFKFFNPLGELVKAQSIYSALSYTVSSQKKKMLYMDIQIKEFYRVMNNQNIGRRGRRVF